jgi:hypothetical protein
MVVFSSAVHPNLHRQHNLKAFFAANFDNGVKMAVIGASPTGAATNKSHNTAGRRIRARRHFLLPVLDSKQRSRNDDAVCAWEQLWLNVLISPAQSPLVSSPPRFTLALLPRHRLRRSLR